MNSLGRPRVRADPAGRRPRHHRPARRLPLLRRLRRLRLQTDRPLQGPQGLRPRTLPPLQVRSFDGCLTTFLALRLFIFHHNSLGGCAVSSVSRYETPLYDLPIDAGINEELLATGEFEVASFGDNRELNNSGVLQGEEVPCIKLMSNLYWVAQKHPIGLVTTVLGSWLAATAKAGWRNIPN